ncbi:MAG TPA: hypothetical protein VK453_20610 [Micromonosporaceae bacterium]|nr:hypothetical protein [Micromonosporaceae bacterium]
MFVCSDPVLVFEHFRVPYRTARDETPVVDGYATLAPSASPDRSMRWPRLRADPAVQRLAGDPRRFELGGMVLHGRVLPEQVLRESLLAPGRQWSAAQSLTAGGEQIGSVWRSDAGDIVLPFDPDEVVSTFWSEGYQTAKSGAPASRVRSIAVSGYYLLRPLIPRPVQIAARRLYSKVQARTPFPRWPVEPSLHEFLDQMLAWAAQLAGEEVPHIAAWPDGRTWALILTHDVETADGLRQVPELRDIEIAAGFRSSWNLVPRRYQVSDDVVAELKAAGFEIGLHGLYHDGRDLADGFLQRRLPEMQQWAQRWDASGFRSPATHRAWDTMSSLPFEYDSSYPDSDPFEPQPGGCCSWLPYFNGQVVELPITLPQDHTLFVILRQTDARIWISKAEKIRAAGGMALLITHPDYLGLGPIAAAYKDLLGRFADDPDLWRALPIEVSRWWRRRAESTLERTADGWRVVGPASDEGRVVVTGAAPAAPGPHDGAVNR